jgi:hypothetical protein
VGILDLNTESTTNFHCVAFSLLGSRGKAFALLSHRNSFKGLQMKLKKGIAVVACCGLLSTSCSMTVGDTSVGPGAGSNIKVGSDNKVNSDNTENRGGSVPPNQPLSKKIGFSCKKSANSDDRLFVADIGSRPTPLINVKTGIEGFGKPYNKDTRCQQIGTKADRLVTLGAKYFKADTKKGMAVICGSKEKYGECFKDKNGDVMEIVTFRSRGLLRQSMADALTQSLEGKTVAEGAAIIESRELEVIDLERLVRGD